MFDRIFFWSVIHGDPGPVVERTGWAFAPHAFPGRFRGPAAFPDLRGQSFATCGAIIAAKSNYILYLYVIALY